jgi:DNA-binding FadR family transcriptional regulator
MTDPIRIEFDSPIQRESVAEMVVRRILDMVKAGVLKAGDALPPERGCIRGFTIRDRR